MGERRDGELISALAVEKLARLVVKLGHRGRTGATRSLVGRDDHALDRRNVVERLQGQRHDDGRAIGVGDDAAMPLGILRIDFGNDQRHVFLHAKRARVVDHDCTSCDDRLAHFLRDAGSCREKGDVHSLECPRSHFTHNDVSCGYATAAAEGNSLASRASRSESANFGCGEIEVMQDVHEFLPNRTSCAGNGYYRVCGHLLFPSHKLHLSE